MILNRQRKFNAVVNFGEFGFDAKRKRLIYYSLLKMVNVPKLDRLADRTNDRSLVINDGMFRYFLQGRAGMPVRNVPVEEIELDGSLKFRQGVIVSPERTIESYALENDPRAIFTAEGLIFLNKKIDNYAGYLICYLDQIARDAFDLLEPDCRYRDPTNVLARKLDGLA